jgi:hypothetical protein
MKPKVESKHVVNLRRVSRVNCERYTEYIEKSSRVRYLFINLAHPPNTHPPHVTLSTYYKYSLPNAPPQHGSHPLTKTPETRRPRFIHLSRVAGGWPSLVSTQAVCLSWCVERSHISSFMRTRVYSSEDRAAAIFAFHALQLHLDLLELGLCIWQVQGSELDRDVGGHF